MPEGEHLRGVDDEKYQRMYEHIKESLMERGETEEEAKRIAAMTVNKRRAEEGDTST